MFLLDTNIISEIRKGDRCDVGVATWFLRVPETELMISVLTLGEIRKGIEMARSRRDSHQADVLEHWLQTVYFRFADRIFPIDERVADAWGRMYRLRNVPAIDGLLAATAAVYDLTLVTRNSADVDGLGVPVLNPFSARGNPTTP